MIRAADDYTGGGVAGIGSGSESVLGLIRVLAVLHFGYFLSAFAALGLGAAAFAHGLAWSTGTVSRWLGRLGLGAGALLLLTPLAVTADVLFLPFFLGAILTLLWFFSTGLSLSIATEPNLKTLAAVLAAIRPLFHASGDARVARALILESASRE